MALSKVTYTDLVTVIGAQNLNDIQDAVISLEGSRTSDEATLNTLDGKVGNLSNLTTTDKSNLVSAINELDTDKADTSDIPAIDTTLTVAGAAADAKATGDAIAEINAEIVPEITQSVNDWLDAHPEATTTVEDGSITEAKLNDSLKVIEYNILDYPGNTLNEKWDNMKADFVAWQNKQIIIPYPRENCNACIKVGNDWKWKVSAPITFDDKCNCSNIEIHGELYAVSAVNQVLLFDDVSKPENIYFTNGVEIRGNRFDGHTIGCAIEIRAGARINFSGQVIINDCDYGIIIGGNNQSASSEAYFDRVQVGFFDTRAVYVYGKTYVANLFANLIEMACAQTANIDCVEIYDSTNGIEIGGMTYATDTAKDGYTTYDANSVLRCHVATGDLHNVFIGYIYATNATYGAYLDGTSNDGGSLYDIHIGFVGIPVNNAVALYATYCKQMVIDGIKDNNQINVTNCFYSRINIKSLTGSTVDKFCGVNSVINLDGTTGINDVPSIANKNIGAITLVKNANGQKVYFNTGDTNIPFDGQMFVPAISSLPTPDWKLRGKMYRVNNDSGQDVIAVCIRYGGNSYKWFDLIANAVI